MYVSDGVPAMDVAGRLDATDNMYPLPENIRIKMIRMARSYGVTSNSGNSKSFGSTSKFDLDIGVFIDALMLEITLAPTHPAGTYFQEGWGYQVIDEVQIRPPGSAPNLYTMKGTEWFTQLLQQCFDKPEQRLALIAMGGKEILDGTIGLTPAERTCLIFVPIWFTNPNSADNHCPMDMSIFPTPVQINIKYNQLFNIASGIGAIDPASPSDLEAVNIQQWTLELDGKDGSSVAIGEELRQRSTDRGAGGLNYPLLVNQQYDFPWDAAVVPTAKVSLNLQGFSGGSLVSLVILIIDNDNLENNRATGRQARFLYETVDRLILRYQNNILFETRNDKYDECMQAVQNSTSKYLVKTRINPAEYGNLPPSGEFYATEDVESLQYKVVFSKNDPFDNPQRLENTKTYGGTVMQLEIYTKKEYPRGITARIIPFYNGYMRFTPDGSQLISNKIE